MALKQTATFAFETVKRLDTARASIALEGRNDTVKLLAVEYFEGEPKS